MNIKTEVWMDIKGYEGLYMISNYGRVRSFDRESSYLLDGKLVTRRRKGKILKASPSSTGYLQLNLSKEAKSELVRIHRLVAEHFVDGQMFDLEVNHIDGDKENNRADNLEWITHKENMEHAYANGLCKVNEARSVIMAEFLFNPKKKAKEIAEENEVSLGYVYNVKKQLKKGINSYG